MNIQDKMQEIHHKYGVSEKANYEIQLFVEGLLKEQKEQLLLQRVSHRSELLRAYTKWLRQNDHLRNAPFPSLIGQYFNSL